MTGEPKTGAEIRRDRAQRESDLRMIAESMKAKQWAIEKVVQLAPGDPKVVKELTEFFYEFLKSDK